MPMINIINDKMSAGNRRAKERVYIVMQVIRN